MIDNFNTFIVMDEMKTIRLMTCDSIPEAHMIKGRLKNEGIECYLKNEESTNVLPMLNNMAGGGVQIMVFERDREKAEQIINEELNSEDEE